MDPITALALTETVQGVSSAVRSLTDETGSEAAQGFDAVLRGMLTPDSADSVNEEELFSALIAERLAKHAGSEAAESYQSLLEERKQANTRADGYVNVEKAANEALNALIQDGTISQEVGSTVKQESFAAAQLDDNKTALYDGRGGSDDPTIAVMNMEAALIQAREIIDNIESGDAELPEAEDNSTETETGSSTGTASSDEQIQSVDGNVDGAGGFLLKPSGDHSQKMVILMDSLLAQQVQELVLKDQNGNEIERGVSSGYANPDENGEREHFRFQKAGEAYPRNLTIEVTLTDGTIKEYFIPDPSQRND